MAAVCSYYPLELQPSQFLGRTLSFLEKKPFQHMAQNYRRRPGINALFWGSKKAVEQFDTSLLLGEFSLTGSGSESAETNSLLPKKVSISAISSISEVSSEEWDACAVDMNGPEKLNPFLSHGFLSSLEESRCSVKETGWAPKHIIAKDEVDNVIGVVPLYLKSHSYGEYVFGHSWANAYYSYGSRYYPKLQSCVPFTPVTGPRILLRNTACKDEIFDIIVSALKDLTTKFQVSSMHVTFPNASQWQRMKEKGFFQRIGMQYHWKNRNYKNFDGFLMDLKQSKRKNIRQERKKISAQNLTMKRLRGYEIKMIWQPYTEAVLSMLPDIFRSDSHIWRSRASLICYDIVELHLPDRVLQQFGLLQPIPIGVDTNDALHKKDRK